VSQIPHFLSLEHVLRLHAIAIEDQGGNSTLRDRSMLESAVATPAQQFSGQYLHANIPAMGAAYAFHISMNHPFLDGNKRAATAAMIAFLADNGWSFDASADEAEAVILQLAAGSLDKAEFSFWVSKHAREKPTMELREFFSRIAPAEFGKRFLSLLPAETGARPDEFSQRAAEAMPAMPILEDLARQQNDARQANDDEGWARVTILSVGLLTLHALAEDMGYEW
jgi:death-on-curing protein